MSTRKCFYSHRVCVSLHWRASTCKSQGGERIVGVGWGGVWGRKGWWENSPSVVIFLPRRPSTVTIEGGQLHDWSFLFWHHVWSDIKDSTETCWLFLNLFQPLHSLNPQTLCCSFLSKTPHISHICDINTVNDEPSHSIVEHRGNFKVCNMRTDYILWAKIATFQLWSSLNL